MKFAFGEFHLWYQVALSMVACGKVRPRARWGCTLPSEGLGAPLSTRPSESGRGWGNDSENIVPRMLISRE